MGRGFDRKTGTHQVKCKTSVEMNKFSNDNFLTSFKQALLISKIENHNERLSLPNLSVGVDVSPQKSK